MRDSKLLLITVTLLLITVRDGTAQVLESEIRRPDELLEKYLLYSDEVSQCYGVKLIGQRSNKQKDLAAEIDFYIISAKVDSRKASYIAFGKEVLGSGKAVQFEELLNVGDRKLYKISSGMSAESRPTNAISKDNQGNPVERKVANIDKFDALALPLTSLTSILDNKISMDVVRDRLINSKLINSSVDKGGNVIGEFLVPNRATVIQIAFSAKSGYFPTEARFFVYDKVSEKRKETPFGINHTEWTPKLGEVRFPKRIELSLDSDPIRINDKYDLEWASCDDLATPKIDFEKLSADNNRSDWKAEFLKVIGK